ncbi:30S ribosomal protein S9 [Patescibacteria group bacterium]
MTKEIEEKTIENKENKSDDITKLKGRYINAIGRRKTSVARVRMYKKGSGIIIVNEKKINQYFPVDLANILKLPLKQTNHLKDLNFSILVKGSGKKSQAEAARHGISQVLVKMDEEYKAVLKTKGWLTRDARRKERKKPGLKKARRAPQWSKR